jgi:YHS domain-containing protein
VSAIAIFLRFLFVLVLLRMISRTVAAFLRPRAPEPARPRVKPPTDLVRDPVCNTFLPQDRALRAVVDGKPEFFCSEACRDRALLKPSLAS